MNPLQNFLDRFQKLLTYPGQVKKPILECLEKISKIKLTEKDIDVKEGIIYLRLQHPAIKNEIFMRKNLILAELRDCVGAKAPYDIR
ncbi:MAG: hypothetical protein M3Q63_00920 [bacterium]|nr:hypothetical protein [bacterium]